MPDFPDLGNLSLMMHLKSGRWTSLDQFLNGARLLFDTLEYLALSVILFGNLKTTNKRNFQKKTQIQISRKSEHARSNRNERELKAQGASMLDLKKGKGLQRMELV